MFTRLRPDYIVGDLDSVLPKVLAAYEARGTSVVRDPGQDDNDLSKCLRLAWELSPEVCESLCACVRACVCRTTTDEYGPTQSDVVVATDAGGRFDQLLANLSTLYAYVPPMTRAFSTHTPTRTHSQAPRQAPALRA